MRLLYVRLHSLAVALDFPVRCHTGGLEIFFLALMSIVA
jgi:hypothetical protein